MITLKNIYKNYTRGSQINSVLKNCNLSIKKGEIIIIMGPSGSGKSTLLNLIGGIDKTDSGTIEVNGYLINKMNEKELTYYRRYEIGIVFQFFNLLPALNVIENVSLPLIISGIDYKKAEYQANKFLKLIKLEHKSYYQLTELSGGEIQRIAIARALINNPPIILADEPTGNLDRKTAHEIIHLLKKISIQLNNTILLVTHNQEFTTIADKIFYFEEGKLKKSKN